MKAKDVYVEKMAAQLQEWRAQIDLLKAKMENAKADAKIAWSQDVDELEIKYDLALEKMREVKWAGDDAWEKIKETSDKVWEDLRTGLSDAASKFKE